MPLNLIPKATQSLFDLGHWSTIPEPTNSREETLKDVQNFQATYLAITASLQLLHNSMQGPETTSLEEFNEKLTQALKNAEYKPKCLTFCVFTGGESRVVNRIKQ